MKVRASAPGKILWLGGYSVLEKGSAAYVTAVDKRCAVTAEKTGGNRIEIRAPQLKAKTEFSAGGELPLRKETLFVEKAVEACSRYLSEKGVGLGGMKIATKSDAAFVSGAGKSGLGASAAITVATVAAVLELHEMNARKQLVHNIAQYAHSQAQGKVGSGFDVACSAYGSCVYSRYSPELVENADANSSLAKLFEMKWDCRIKPLALSPSLLPAFANILGENASTSAMVRHVMEWKKNNEGEYCRVIKQLNNANDNAVESLKKNDLETFKRFFELGRALTARLGKLSGVEIEPPELRELVDKSERNGAFAAKLPGAGGGDAIAAFCTSSGERARLQQFWKDYTEIKLEPIELNAGAEGVILTR